MKKVVLSLSAVFLMSGLYAQQTEINAANAAYKAKNYTETLAQASQAEAKLTEDRSISPEDLALFYFNAGQAAQASGDMVLAAKYFSKLNDVENAPHWKAKNKDSKKWEYFYDNKEAQKVTSAGNYGKLKEGQASSSHLQGIANQLNQDANTALGKGNEAFKAQNYSIAGDEFLKAYYLYQAVGKDNDLLKYYSALAKLQTDDKATAATMLQELVDNKFTGVTTNYFATDKATGEKVAFASKADMDTQTKLGIVTNPKVEKTESLEEELFSNTTYAWYAVEDWDKALTVGQEGLEKYPENQNMNQIVTGVYYKTGNSDKFVQTLRDKIANNTAGAVDYFNLAKSLEDSEGDSEEVIQLYKKSIELDPTFGDAYLNLAFAIISPEKEYVTIMNDNLGSSSKEKRIYQENNEKRKALYVEAVPYLEKAYEISPDNISLIKVLKTSYDVLGDDDKFLEFKKLYEEKAHK